MEAKTLSKNILLKKQFIMLWIKNYEFGESLIDLTNWARFESIDNFVTNLVMSKDKQSDETFRFKLLLNENEEKKLKSYLLRNKLFVLKYIGTRESFEPYTHLYQLYLQYLSSELNEIEKSVLLDGYLHMLADLTGKSPSEERLVLERSLNIRYID